MPLNNMSSLYTTVITLFILLTVGYIARKVNLIDETASKKLSTLIMCVGQPFMIIGSQMKIEYSAENLKSGLFVLVLGIAVHIIFAVVSFFAMMKISDVNERKISEFAVVFANCGFMGFPLLESMLGQRGLFYGSFYIIVFNLFTWTWGMVILGRKRSDIKINPFKMIVNYGTLPSIIGFAIFALRIPIPLPVSNAVSYIGSICTPISMLITGGLISTISFKKLFSQKIIYYISILKLIIIPLFICVTASLIGLSDEMVFFVTIVSSLPTAANTVMFSEMYDINQPISASAVGVTTLLSTVTLPFVIWLSQIIIKVI